MLRVHYDIGPNYCDDVRLRNKEFTGYDRESEVIGLRDLIIERGLSDRHQPYRTPKNDGLWSYEYWVAPSQVIGFEIIEYSEDDT